MKCNKILKTGFSLAELIVTLAIVGILTVTAMSILQPQADRGTKYLYASAYKSLSTAFYNGVLKGYNPFLTEQVLDDADEVDEMVTLCRALSGYINTTNNIKAPDVYNADGTVTLGADYDAVCNLPFVRFVQPDTINFAGNQTFIANNDMFFYITPKIVGADEDLGFNFFIVFVDINGEKAPNSLDPALTPNGIPDVYAFAMINGGKVVPLGHPEYDTRIMTARFAYYDANANPLYSDRSMAYYQAKNAAWGHYANNNMNAFNEHEPFTLNDRIRRVINTQFPNNEIYKDFPENLAGADYPKPGVQFANPFNCSDLDIESCYVFIEEYKSY